jgi:plastocyanin
MRIGKGDKDFAREREGMMQIRGGCAVVVFGALMAGLVGCKPSESLKQAQGIDSSATKANAPAAAAPTSPVDAATLGTVSGIVHFTGVAPKRVKIDMSQDPVCSITGGDNYSEQYVVKDGKLANVYMYVKSGPAAAMAGPMPIPAPVVLDQVGCKYVPHVIAVMRGGSVEFRNSDSTMHNIHTMPAVPGNQPVDVSQGPKGTPEVKVFAQPEVMMPVRCNNHPWMNAFINVSATPFFAMTDTDGHFAISGLPAGDYVLAAVHEKMGEQELHVTVKAHETAKADYAFSAKK